MNTIPPNIPGAVFAVDSQVAFDPQQAATNFVDKDVQELYDKSNIRSKIDALLARKEAIEGYINRVRRASIADWLESFDLRKFIEPLAITELKFISQEIGELKNEFQNLQLQRFGAVKNHFIPNETFLRLEYKIAAALNGIPVKD